MERVKILSGTPILWNFYKDRSNSFEKIHARIKNPEKFNGEKNLW